MTKDEVYHSINKAYKLRLIILVATTLLFLAATILFYLYVDHNQVLALLGKAVREFQPLPQKMPMMSALLYLLIYTVLAALAVPGLFILTTLGGIVFSFERALLLTMLGSASGCYLHFTLTRHFFSKSVQHRWKPLLNKWESGRRKSTMLWVIIARMIPVVPYYLVNIVMAMSKITPFRFFLGTIIGMIPIHAIYCNIGHNLTLNLSIQTLFSPVILRSLMLLMVVALCGMLGYRKFNLNKETDMEHNQ